ncbi:hypothetical protein TVAG_461080 [Trichomonas vaginalis G3]|uniref:Nucleolar GTP-binding protein 1 n=1 Tax=Trichomonas vaginalis (strain ATCC PRA-98 / G3) TaxID=412133 RepID=A2DY82_TRIV3|nr:nucleolar GTP-binding protein 1 family [Trichomonas vaginalis G3]EAY14691.1 hypothetical protein TVAG_461080 [Trichomonas vaginalis G3]KAI5505455.1 nucleolar GTP-binding protein 1 family [Trichomonas vaginalis G3]|eukprot:XP_001326914.1 hypothetical protein [Trichomonas vaginalis G3]
MALVFGNIHAVPKSSQELIDTVLSSTNRKTATIIHPGFKISRIRDFYMNKVNFARDQFTSRLTQILEDFPRLDSIHPFWASLINVIYDRDHYKLALGQIIGAKTLIHNVGRDYVKYLKYGDSLFRCKQLKKAALGRMCTACRRLTPSLQYLEEVRQHLQRLPAIDPSAPTIILAGAPSTGKSSFMNQITRANVEVAAFPFTTKSLYLGHTDWAFLTWQVIDTPGLLDRPLEKRNTIEMQSVMAMVHLRAAIVYMLDISGTCGYSVEQQVSLYHSLGEIFANRPVTVVLTKTDLVNPDNMSPEDKALIDSMQGPNVSFMRMSSMTGDGVSEVKEHVCQGLRKMRVDSKKNSDKISQIESQLHIAKPEQTYEPNIPASVANPQGLGRPTQKELEEMAGGAGQYAANTNAERDLKNPEWQNDVMPEIIEGRNIADYIDPDIEKKFAALLEEEKVRYQNYQAVKQAFEENKWKVTPEQEEMVSIIRERRQMIRNKAEEKRNGRPGMPEKMKKQSKSVIADRVDSMLQERGVDESARQRAVDKVLSEKPSRVERKLEPEKRDTGIVKHGAGERFDYYVKTNYILEPKFLFSGKAGFKRDYK